MELDLPLTPGIVELLRPGQIVTLTLEGRAVNVPFEQGRLRIESVAEGIVRVRFTPYPEFMPRRSWAVTPPDGAFEAPDWEVAESREGWHLTLPGLTLTLIAGRVTFWREGVAFSADLEAPGWREAVLAESRIRAREGDVIPAGRVRLELRLKKALRPNERLYGLGQRSGKLERRGRKFSHWTIDPDFGHGRHQDNLYQAQPVFLALKEGVAWGLYLNCSYYSQIDVGASQAALIATPICLKAPGKTSGAAQRGRQAIMWWLRRWGVRRCSSGAGRLCRLATCAPRPCCRLTNSAGGSIQGRESGRLSRMSATAGAR